MLKPKSTLYRLIWPLPVLLLTACVTQPLSPPVEPARVPALPTQAKVSLIPIPLACSPTCLAAATNDAEKWRTMLIGSESPEQPVKQPTGR